ncbi:hypothetical protein Vc3S01_2763 [Vibrio campbellii]|nr:hypothetical protein Vc3S01_2763 [Vibrio campbellii]EDL68162.1 hypothetical protein A1Q_2728 [Vibrio campbellii HY01]
MESHQAVMWWKQTSAKPNGRFTGLNSLNDSRAVVGGYG